MDRGHLEGEAITRKTRNPPNYSPLPFTRSAVKSRHLSISDLLITSPSFDLRRNCISSPSCTTSSEASFLYSSVGQEQRPSWHSRNASSSFCLSLPASVTEISMPVSFSLILYFIISPFRLTACRADYRLNPVSQVRPDAPAGP